jgi:pyruvate/2-oxoglutarate dehydrogenase complex dihydrolipoamide acyltransferase (E2) component
MTTFEFQVPDIGEGLADVEIVEWLVSVGDSVAEHQVLATVETDKSVIELPSPYTGVVRELRGERGDRIPVGAVLVVIDGEGAGPAHTTTLPPVNGDEPRPVVPPAGESPAPRPRPGRGRAAPAVRRLARELGVTLDAVVGSGAGGIVLADDVRAAAASVEAPAADSATVAQKRSAAAPGRDAEVAPLRGLRRTIARNMAAVARIPHITSHREVPAGELLAWRAMVNQGRERPLTITPFLAACVLGALRVEPRLNATFDEDKEEITTHRAVHLGIAAATDDGLLVPVVHDADQLGLAELGDAIEQLAVGARARTLAPSDLAGGTFTITNYGTSGGWFGTPLLRAPEIGIAGFGRAESRPWVVEGEVAVVPVLPISVSVDHRIIDGDVLGSFAGALAEFVADPRRLLSVTAPWS